MMSVTQLGPRGNLNKQVCTKDLFAAIKALGISGASFDYGGASGQKGNEARMTPTVLIMNGPNLNMLGTRQPDIYGRDTLVDVIDACRGLGTELGLKVEDFQSNHEGALIDRIHAAQGNTQGIIINAGAYSHTSIAILDALNIFEGQVIEVHISNIHQREPFRHHTYISQRADGIIIGMGIAGYTLALRRLASLVGS